MNPTLTAALAPLKTVPVQASWEQTVVDVALSVLTSNGQTGLAMLETYLSNAITGKSTLDELESSTLSLRQTSDLLAILENAEADRLDRSHQIIKDILSLAATAAEELLKAALGGTL